jgi:uncharacterized lipoprotein YmbA
MSHMKKIGTIVLALSLGGCASAPPVRYYTLVPSGVLPGESAPRDTSSATAPPAASFQFELLPVSVPVQVDQPQLVVRQGGQGIALLGGERWIAPLADEVRGALSADLARDLGAQDVSGLPASGQPRLRIKVDLRRFDSVPGSYALIDAAWSVHALTGETTLTCTSTISEVVGSGYEALVRGHQQALAQLAGQIAEAAKPLAAGQVPRCPDQARL